ncbi:MAG: hypothetical protein JJU36_01830 [Phycisphaeraceae bacterium]|nr:hypothetical protein [Phycisphaeraceae bacterium]
MSMLIHCPGCRVSLRVPTHASGHRARCPACSTVFAVPTPGELFDETVSVWLHQSLEAEERRRNFRDEMRIARAVQQVVHLLGQRKACATEAAKPPPAPDMVRIGEEDETEEFDLFDLPGLNDSQISVEGFGSEGQGAAIGPPPDVRPAEAKVRVTVRPTTDDTASADVPDDVKSPSAQPSAPGPAAKTPARPSKPPGAAMPPMTGASLNAEELPTSFPTDPHGARRPYLVVRDVHQGGVTLGFLSHWLENNRFRASMPEMCIFSGPIGRDQLLARPLAFVDRSQARVRSVQEIESRFEVPLKEEHGAWHIMAVMGQLEELPSPFCLPMPYYVGPSHRRDSLELATHRLPDGELMCTVRVPSHRCALTWLANVNGTCGDEHALLAEHVRVLENDAWKSLPDVVRQRLCAWCEFQPGERFDIYVSDAEFGVKDAGLAGIIITSQRIIYHKYHHGGQVPLNQRAAVHIHHEGRLATVVLEREGRRTRCGRLAGGDVERLAKALGRHPAIQISVTDAP